MTKQETRKIFLERRKQLSVDEVNVLSNRILLQFGTLKLRDARLLLSYIPIGSHKEFEVGLCENELKHRMPGLVTALPRLTGEHTMEAIEQASDFERILNKFNIPEPANGKIVAPEEIDLVFVPLIAFDEKGYRVGYGKGYYDRFLKRCRKDCCSIGFSFFEAAPSPEDIHQFDVPLNFCISPLRVYEF